MVRRNDKRIRLVMGADKLFHEKGVSNTTLADIAQLAEVPLGNVYYYFKSKESIVIAVIEYRRKLMQEQFDELNSIDDPKSRIKEFIGKANAHSEATANFGDILGGLCHELGKQGGDIAEQAATLMKDILGWCEKQFSALGKGEAKQLAIKLVSNMQGISLLTLSFKDPNYTKHHTEFLANNWLESV